MTDENSIFIGDKPLLNYLTGVVLQFTTKEAKEILIKARGKFISKAVDIAMLAKERFLSGQININKIEIGSSEFTNKENKIIRVSFIQISLTKI